jgi:hypothetical protein
VSDEVARGPLPPPSFHPDSGAVRFWVAMPAGQPIGASLSKQVLHYRFDAQADGSDAVATYEANRSEIDAAVMRRVNGGSIEPVMLRENDLPLRPRR